MSPDSVLEAKKNAAQTFTPARSLPAPRSLELPRSPENTPASTTPSHDFSRLLVNAPPVAGSCPMSLASPRACPFGGACHTCPARVQAKLAINQPGDVYEQEADRMAEAITRTTEPMVLQRKCTRCEDDDGRQLQTKEVVGQTPASELPPETLATVQEGLHSSGQPLDTDTRAFMEARFGQDFTRVRVHADAKAAASARAVNALAYTVGQDIFFGTGQYTPRTGEGRRLLAHELVHSIQQRSGVRLARERPPSPPPTPSPPQAASCGPDITNWFVAIMNSAKTNRNVLEIQRRLRGASRVGARYGYSATNVLEGGLVRKLVAAEAAAGNPPRTADVSRQIAAADPRNEFGRAVVAATAPIPFVGAPEQMMLAAIRGASLIWKSLVETGAVWDFKNNVLSGARLASAGCPTMCPNPPTVTLCGICVEHDLPGNLFYAYIGKECGFSLNALQLGSQYAEILPSSSGGWDPPEDTAAINLGFGLPATITAGNLSTALASSRGSLTTRPCTLCSTIYAL